MPEFFFLFQTDCLNGTNVHTDAAIDAGVGVYHSFLISHAYCLARAFFHTRLAACAFLPIYFSCHYLTLSKKQFTGKFIRSIPYGTSERRILQNGSDITT
jgi:hypothetical protein